MNAIPAGRDPRSAYSRHVTTRLLDFTGVTTPWTRRLWDVGSFLALEELHEAGVWGDRKVLAQAAVDWQRHALERLLGGDPALGSKTYRRELRECVKTTLTVAGDGRRKLRHLIDIARPGYLDRWAACLAAEDPPRPELAARAVASHLLDSGHSLSGLQHWLREGRQNLSAADLVSEAAALLTRTPRDWSVVVPFQALHRHEELAGHLPHWRTAGQTRTLIAETGVEPPERIVGSMVFDVEARDATREVKGSDLAARLDACASNRSRAAVIAAELRGRGSLPLTRSWRTGSDVATGVSPIALASRAETALRMVGDDLGPDLCDLLE